MKKRTKIWGGVIIILLAVIVFANSNKSEPEPGQYADFAQCITNSGAKMFGAYWCSHCQNQKEKFGEDWQYIEYIECSLPGGNAQTQECIEEGITGYPTWEFGDGSREGGELSFAKLSEKTGCELWKNQKYKNQLR